MGTTSCAIYVVQNGLNLERIHKWPKLFHFSFSQNIFGGLAFSLPAAAIDFESRDDIETRPEGEDKHHSASNEYANHRHGSIRWKNLQNIRTVFH